VITGKKIPRTNERQNYTQIFAAMKKQEEKEEKEEKEGKKLGKLTSSLGILRERTVVFFSEVQGPQREKLEKRCYLPTIPSRNAQPR
jgi:hypothetical protein